MDLQLPFYTNQLWALLVFLVALAVFHLALVWPHSLGKVKWRYLEYFWLFGALLSFLGGVGIARQIYAHNLLEVATARLEEAAISIESDLSVGSVCIRQERSRGSPPDADRIRKGPDKRCEWFRSASKILATSPSEQRRKLTLQDLGGALPESGDDFEIGRLISHIDRYNKKVEDVGHLTTAIERTDRETYFSILGPILLLVALALRITRVTGEIVDDRRAAGASGR